MTILQRAQRIAEKYGTTDPQKILTAMRIKVFEVPIHGIRGMYKQLKRNTFVFVDSSLDDHERRFVLGHELGHHLFHRGQNRVFMDRCTLQVTSRPEIEADTFAVCLMAPDPAEIIFDGETTDQLATRLGVSTRLAELYQSEIMRSKCTELKGDIYGMA